MKEIKVNRNLLFRSHLPEENTWPEREDTPRGDIHDDEGGEGDGIREPRVDPPAGPGSGQERAIPADGE
ncbi:hypothetical protein ACH47Z_33760 [Streptomyces sp. NPDC020192]|uniref:hypothetical protein n=1 Tax=Streptomyces sp. NPDC020192 TaxID=3365066 RepID=UPI0037904018